MTRPKQNIQYYRHCSHPVDRFTGVRSDQTIVLTGPKTSRLYPILPAPRTLPRRRKAVTSGLPDQQLCTAGTEHRATLVLPLASGIILPLDQTTSTDQGLLWHLEERCEDAGVDGAVDLPTGGHPEFAQNSPHSQCLFVRKNPDFTGLSRARRSPSEPDACIQLEMFTL